MTTKDPTAGARASTSATTEDTNDLGFGGRVTRDIRVRFLNPDGTFNVHRHGIGYFRSINSYHVLLTTSWRRFFLFVAVVYFTLNALFAAAYVGCGRHAIQGAAATSFAARYRDCYFFSVQTLATIGYGGLSPKTAPANFLVTVEALAGLVFFALVTGLTFARFSRPVARILFSRHAIIAPFHDGTAFEFRIANMLNNQILNVEARVVFSRLQERDGKKQRVFTELPLERPGVVFFPLHWTVVHPVDEASPLHGLTADDLAEADAEFIVLLSGFDETFSQVVHSRSSYKHHEVVVGARFADMFLDAVDSHLTVDLAKLHDIERVDSA